MLIPLTTLRLRLIDGWQHAWKFSSMRFLAFGGAIQMVLQTAPGSVTQYVPQWVLQTAGTVSFACMIFAALGRVTKVEKSDAKSPDVP